MRGVAIDARADTAQGQRLAVIVDRQVQHLVVGRRQQFLAFLRLDGVVDGADGVDDFFGGQIMSTSNFRVARVATSKGAALSQEARASSGVDCAVDAAAAKKSLVGGVGDGINLELRYVVSHEAHSVVERL